MLACPEGRASTALLRRRQVHAQLAQQGDQLPPSVYGLHGLPGSYTPVDGTGSCIQCEAGRFQGDDLATSCEACGDRVHTAPRVRPRRLPLMMVTMLAEVMRLRGRRRCRAKILLPPQRCRAGFFEKPSTRCSACTAGSYQPNENATSCIPCPRILLPNWLNGTNSVRSNTYAASTSNSVCTACTTCSSGYREDSPCTATATGSASNALRQVLQHHRVYHLPEWKFLPGGRFATIACCPALVACPEGSSEPIIFNSVRTRLTRFSSISLPCWSRSPAQNTTKT